MKKLILILTLISGTCWAKSEPSILLFNTATGHMLVADNIDQVRPLASITKLMTALVSLETGYGLDRELKLARCCGGILPPKVYTRRELLTAMLVRSDNAAAETLAHDYPGSRAEFIMAMNARARDLGMTHTHFEDASGLDARNVSTARDLELLVVAALDQDFIRATTTKLSAQFDVAHKHKLTRVTLNNTNTPLLGEFGSAVLSKTGFISAAGFCVAMAFEQEDQQWIMIIMGARDQHDRRRRAERVLKSLDLK